jgi:hypothetical protein
MQTDSVYVTVIGPGSEVRRFSMDIFVPLVLFFLFNLAVLMLIICLVKYASYLHRTRSTETSDQMVGAIRYMFSSDIVSKKEFIILSLISAAATLIFQVYVSVSS